MCHFKAGFHYITYLCLATLILINSPLCLSQDCRMVGKTCNDHGMCCGGCCFNGYCVEATRSCIMAVDVCMEHYCPPGFECFPYRPPDCMGCEEIPDCRPSTNTVNPPFLY